MKNVLILILSFTLSLIGNAQSGKIQIKGKVNDFETEKGLDRVTVELRLLNDSLISTFTTDTTGKYRLKFVPTGKDYKVSFSKENYVYKYAVVSTTGVSIEDKSDFPLEISSSLFKENGKDYLFLKFAPMAYCKYDKSIDNLIWDTSYIEKIKELIESVKNKK